MVSHLEHRGPTSAAYADIVMVEYNHDEERFARIEHMLELLQRESSATKRAAALRAPVAVDVSTPLAPSEHKPALMFLGAPSRNER